MYEMSSHALQVHYHLLRLVQEPLSLLPPFLLDKLELTRLELLSTGIQHVSYSCRDLRLSGKYL